MGLDFGASFHATPHRGYFIDYVQGDFGLVYLGVNEPCQICGKGKMKEINQMETRRQMWKVTNPKRMLYLYL